MLVRITQLDGSLPNLALMRLSAWHRSQGDEVFWERGTARHMWEPEYDTVYASAIFEYTQKAAEKFIRQFPGALVGGSGGDSSLRVEDIVPSQFVGLDYSGYPDFTGSIGYAMRGCRFKCGFCVVPKQEGEARSNHAIGQIWRGPGYPKDIHLLDNDFFGNPNWRAVVDEIVTGGYRVCINQGINLRLLAGHPWNVPKLNWTPEVIRSYEALADEQVEALVAMKPRDDSFKGQRIYAAWDNLGDEEVFMRGLDRLERHGVNPDHVMVYMLIGYDRRETWDKIFYRYNRMMERGVRPYPMPFHKLRFTNQAHYRRLRQFQAWIIRGTHKKTPFEEFNANHKPTPPEGDLLKWMAA